MKHEIESDARGRYIVEIFTSGAMRGCLSRMSDRGDIFTHIRTIVFAKTEKKDIILAILFYFFDMSKFKNISGSPMTVPNVGAFDTDETRDISPDLDQYFTNSPHFDRIEDEKKTKVKSTASDE